MIQYDSRKFLQPSFSLKTSCFLYSEQCSSLAHQPSIPMPAHLQLIALGPHPTVTFYVSTVVHVDVQLRWRTSSSTTPEGDTHSWGARTATTLLNNCLRVETASATISVTQTTPPIQCSSNSISQIKSWISCDTDKQIRNWSGNARFDRTFQF